MKTLSGNEVVSALKNVIGCAVPSNDRGNGSAGFSMIQIESEEQINEMVDEYTFYSEESIDDCKELFEGEGLDFSDFTSVIRMEDQNGYQLYLLVW